jgi:hypothetical protein
MSIGIFEKHTRCGHPAMNNRLAHWPLNRSPRRIHGLYPTLMQPRQHAIHVLLSYAKADMILRRAAVHDCIHAEQTKHPALMCLEVKQQGTRPIAAAKPEFEAKLRNIEVNCAIQVSDGKVHFVEATMELLCWGEMSGGVQGLTRFGANFAPLKTQFLDPIRLSLV